jgi:hypothetical protein
MFAIITACPLYGGGVWPTTMTFKGFGTALYSAFVNRRAALLFLLAPTLGEVITGASPPLSFFNPFTILFIVPLYGSAAVLAREIARRLRLGWSGLLLIGAAYGVLEEGLVLNSWFNPYYPDVLALHGQGRLMEINWIFAIAFILYHSVLSITMPVILAESIFPEHADEPWLGRAGLVMMTMVLAAEAITGFALFGFVAYRNVGYQHPPPSYVVALALAAGLFWLALRQRSTKGGLESTPPPRLWTLRLAALAVTVMWVLIESGMPNVIKLGLIPVLALLVLAAVAARTVRGWARRPGWGPQHRLALVAGIIGFWILLSPVTELTHPAGRNTLGMILIGLLSLIAMIVLSRRVARQAPLHRTFPA